MWIFASVAAALWVLGAHAQTMAADLATGRDWYIEHAPELAALFVHVVAFARIVVKYTPTPNDDTVLAKIVELAKFFGLVIPEEKVSGNRKTAMLDRNERFQARRGLRRQVDRVARRNGFNLTDEELDIAVEECSVEHQRLNGGVLGNLLKWITENPEIVLAIIKMLFSMGPDTRLAVDTKGGAS